jgi:hypothetical protein
MRDSFNSMLTSARTDRDRVNFTFLQTTKEIEADKQGFGVNFWGWTWKLRMFEDFYTSPTTPAGKSLRCNLKYDHLKERLKQVADGDTSWVRGAMAADSKVQKEIVDVAGVQKFCSKWLRLLVEAEKCAPREDMDTHG